MKLKLSQIIIGERQRLELGDLSDLDSMSDSEVGQIHPIIVHKLLSGYELVAGRRRLAKATELGWTEIEALERDTMTESQKNKVELLEDISRKDRSWQDTCLSIAKVHFLLSKEHKERGESWGYRQTAKATNFGRTYIGRLLEVAELLQEEPKNEEAWACKNFFEAYQILVKREEMQARVELERRRMVMNQQEGLVPRILDVVEETGPFVNMEGTEPGEESLVHKVDETGKERPLTIYIQGENRRFTKTDPSEWKETIYCIIGHEIKLAEDELTHLIYRCQLALRQQGYAAFWFDEPPKNPPDLESIYMPWRLIWNKITFVESDWPFCPNYGVGVIMCKEGIEPKNNPNTNTSIISAVPNDDDTLPMAVVDYTLQACCPPNMAVITLNSELAVTIAELGYIPIFFEPDKAKFDKVCNDLKEYYERNVPGVIVKMP